MHELLHLLGLKDPNGMPYLFWSGVGANALAIAGGTLGYFRLKKQHNRRHKQLKDHIDYKFSKLTDEESN